MGEGMKNDPQSLGEMPTMDPRRGDSLGRIDKYELVRELGEGGFGAVYLAHDTVAKTDVAIKGLPPEVKHNNAELECIRVNFALVKRLRHPNIVAVTDLHLAQAVSYASPSVKEKLRVFERDTMVVMDYAPGVTLSQWRKQFPGGRVPLDKALAVVRQIADALDYAHARKVIHRDVKPANIMVETSDDGEMTVRVLDFGLAAEIRSSMGRVSREIRDTCGTRPYMAPEQWLGRKQGPATDQYALAVLFYELVVSEVPFASVFDCGDPPVMRLAVTTDKPAIPANLPKAVRRALAVALAKNPEERFASCGDFVGALEGKVKVPRRGGVGMAALAAAALAIAALAGGVWWWHGRQTSDATVHEAPVTPLSPDHAPPTPPVVDTLAEPAKPAEPTKPAEATSSGGEPAAVKHNGRMSAEPNQVELMLEAMEGDLKRRVTKDMDGEMLAAMSSNFTGNAKAILQRNTNSVVAASLKTGDTKTLTLPGGATMEMIYVAPGSFTMGSPESEDGHKNTELQHRVTLTKGFWLGKCEVTQKQWQSVMDDNPSRFKSPDRPVENVSWEDCQKFIEKVNAEARRQLGGEARLPTEAEWEYACRANTKGEYALRELESFTMNHPDAKMAFNNAAWYSENSDSQTHPVGQKKPNAWGFHDMHGNICEWCSDWYGKDYYKSSPSADPQGPVSGVSRVLRGGGWYYLARFCRSANRNGGNPGFRNGNFGFRLCCSAEDVASSEETTTYIVQCGDYLAKISKKFGVSISSIRRLNSLRDDNIRLGQKLKLPGRVDVGEQKEPEEDVATPKPVVREFKPYTGPTKDYVVKIGDTLGSIAYSNGINIRQLKQLNGLDRESLHVGQTLKVPAEKVIPSAAPASSTTSSSNLKTGDKKTLTLPGGATMEMIYVAPGSFTMGSPDTEEGRCDNEMQHSVTLTKGFWLGELEVTQKQWQSVMGDNPAQFKGESQPVEKVSWEDCQRFVQKVNAAARQQLGGKARLPTEAEWEYACRAGSSTAYFWGNSLNGDRANCDGSHPCGITVKGRYKEEITPVGSYPANAWGFYDMHGNVWEWCSDWYGKYYYKSGPSADPQGPASGVSRVMRGGGWGSLARFCRSAFRGGNLPGHRANSCGFRLCCSALP